MNRKEIEIKLVTENDVDELLEIYKYYVEETAVTFEYDVPSREEFKNRIINISKGYPYIAAVMNHKIVGYAYAHRFHERRAYDWSVETTIYMDHNHRRTGVGRILYDKLEEILKRQNITNLNACIAYIDAEDEYLTNGSTYFHKKSGYELAGKFHKSGFKFNRWYDMIWMEKMIGDHLEEQPDIILFEELKEVLIKEGIIGM